MPECLARQRTWPLFFVMIYGPPAVGKLTVASALAAQTGFRVFDNHATINAVTPVFEFGSAPYERIVNDLRLAMFREAAAEEVSLIFTVVYAQPVDDELFGRYLAPFDGPDHVVAAVRLHADPATIRERVGLADRRARHKISDPVNWDEIVSQYQLDGAIPHVPSLAIDTTTTAPEPAATTIIEHFNLPRRGSVPATGNH